MNEKHVRIKLRLMMCSKPSTPPQAIIIGPHQLLTLWTPGPADDPMHVFMHIFGLIIATCGWSYDVDISLVEVSHYTAKCKRIAINNKTRHHVLLLCDRMVMNINEGGHGKLLAH